MTKQNFRLEIRRAADNYKMLFIRSKIKLSSLYDETKFSGSGTVCWIPQFAHINRDCASDCNKRMREHGTHPPTMYSLFCLQLTQQSMSCEDSCKSANFLAITSHVIESAAVLASYVPKPTSPFALTKLIRIFLMA